MPLNARPAGDVVHDGLRLRAFDFTSQEGVELRLGLLTAATVEKPSLVVLSALDESGWKEWTEDLGPAFQGLLQLDQPPKLDAAKFAQNRKTLAFNKWAFAAVAPVLIVVGIAIGFIPPPHFPAKGAGPMVAAVGVIFAGTALPEEILFRSLIQNLLMLRFGHRTRVLLVASFIFGCAHLDNGPQPLPNWRYMIVATIAGIAYGGVFQHASTVLSSAALHCLVDWTKHFFF